MEFVSEIELQEPFISDGIRVCTKMARQTVEIHRKKTHGAQIFCQFV